MKTIFLTMILVFITTTAIAQIPTTAEYQISVDGITWSAQTVTQAGTVTTINAPSETSTDVVQNWVISYSNTLYKVTFERTTAGKYYFRWRLSSKGLWSEYGICTIIQPSTPIKQ